ncbi:MAG: hypothetical protein AAGE61_20845 [Pseudomonadota bacterium]
MRNCPENGYLSHPTEMLVLKGYRQWMAGIATKDISHWNETWNMFCRTLGPPHARACMDALVAFVGTLRLCANCPLKTLDPTCSGLCRDECLVVGLLAALQHGDEAALNLCLNKLTSGPRSQEVTNAAGELAIALKAAGFVLCPVPINVLYDIAFDEMPSQSVH